LHRRDYAYASDPEQEADDQAEQAEAQTAPHERRDDLTAPGAKRRANPNLTDPLPDRERDDGVETDAESRSARAPVPPAA
jgi:hypothetical protein